MSGKKASNKEEKIAEMMPFSGIEKEAKSVD